MNKDSNVKSSPFPAWAVPVGLILCVYAAITLPFLPGRLSLDNDSYLFLRQTEFFAGARTDAVAIQGSKIMDSLRYYPTGRDWLNDQERILLPRVLGGVCRGLGTITGRPLSEDRIEASLLWAAPILAGLFALCVYVFARRSIGASGALWAGLLAATSPAVFTRIWPGSCSKEALAMPLIVAWLYAAGRGLKARSTATAALWACGAGLGLDLASLAWGGDRFFLEVFTLFGLIALPFVATAGEAPWGWPLVVVSAWLWSWPLSVLGPGASPTRPGFHMAALAVVAALWAMACLSSRFLHGARGRAILIVAAAAGAGLILFQHHGAVLGLLNDLRRSGLGLNRLTVFEYRPASLKDMTFLFGPSLALALLGGAWSAVEAFKRRDSDLLLLVVWLSLGLVGSRAAIRLVLPAAVPVAVCAALFWQKLRPLGKGARLAAHAALAAALTFNVAQTLRLERHEARRMLPRAHAWRDAGRWLQEHTPADSIMVAWWDEGYFLQTLARRATIVDPGNGGPPVPGAGANRNVDVARMLMGDEARFKALISPYNPQGRPLYLVVTRDDLRLTLAIAFHAGEPWPPRAKAGSGPLLARLLPAAAGGLGTPPSSFEPVYGQDGIFAYRYRPAPHG